MDVKEAVKIAKEYVADIFGSEGAANIGLEEVEFLDSQNIWQVTIGFSRPWDRGNNPLFSAMREDVIIRTYKVLRVDDVEKIVLSVKNREKQS